MSSTMKEKEWQQVVEQEMQERNAKDKAWMMKYATDKDKEEYLRLEEEARPSEKAKPPKPPPVSLSTTCP